MKIKDIKVMRGPNYWSNYRKKLIVLTLDIGHLENLPTNQINGFADRMEALLPSLVNHKCSEVRKGGFFNRVREGTWMGHVVEHIALELQWLAGMRCGFGRTRTANRDGIYYVVFSYEIEAAGIYAASAAVKIAKALVNNESYDVHADILALKKIHRRESYGPSTHSIVQEAEKRGLPVRVMDNGKLVFIGQGIRQKCVSATIASSTSSIGVDLASDKQATKDLLAKFHIPVADGKIVDNRKELIKAIGELGYPLVIKPRYGNQGRGVAINVQGSAEAEKAFAAAKKISDSIVVERLVDGFDFRFLVINYRLVAAARRTPPSITGDGARTIRNLIDELNADPRRGDGHDNVLTRIPIDAETVKILHENNVTQDTVLPEGKVIPLKKTANLSTGGTASDITDQVHPYNVWLAERIARIVQLDICGIDIIATDVRKPLDKTNGAVIEVNAAPGFRMHLAPVSGVARNVAEPVLDMLFPDGKCRIPVVAVTGTNGKTTTTRLIAHMARIAGYNVGYCSTDGIYVSGTRIFKGDCTGPTSAQTVLNDPTVDFAVLECARGGIVRNGLGFDYCNISVVTNVTDDHLGLDGIETLDNMARVKSVVPRSTFTDGYAVLNADDDLVYAMRQDTMCNIALFSLSADNERVQTHCENGGFAAVIERGWLTVYKGEWKTRIMKVDRIPLSFNKTADFMIRNVLAAVLCGAIHGFTMEDIRAALQSFVPSPAVSPGRMNIFEFANFKVMVDYAHNAGSMMELKKFFESIEASRKVGIITGIGDRRDNDIENIGYWSAQIFDEIIIRLDKDLRGRSAAQIVSLLQSGINKVNPDISTEVIADECTAIQHAIDRAEPNAFITVFTEDVERSLECVRSARDRMSGPGHMHEVSLWRAS